MENYSADEHINVGTGVDLSIRELAETIREVVNPTANIEWDTSKPDGTPRKLLDVSRLRDSGWEPRITLTDGLADTYQWFLEAHAEGVTLRGVDAL
jgi:GDP-L-fucose synthase